MSCFFFDSNDYALLRIVNDVLDHSRSGVRALLAPYMHPNGIKRMASPWFLRVAYAIASLLGSLEGGSAASRLRALRSLKDEVLLSRGVYFQKNTARVLLQIMKELVRHQGDEAIQLRLAHDFRMASSGKIRTVRAELDKYRLLEMPEEWNQLAFDDHVHDANTKGRKSPTHLVMDAWIKGIRFLTVVYYNYISSDVAHELLEAAAILDIHIRIGIEVSSRFRGKYVRVVWEPLGYADSKSFLAFLDEKPVRAFMKEGWQVSAYQQKYVFEALRAYNSTHRLAMATEYGLDLAEISEAEFSRFVGTGQPSLLHLAKFIQNGMQPKLQQAAAALGAEYATATSRRRQELDAHLTHLNAIDSELLITRFLQPCRNPDLHDPTVPQEHADVPGLLRLGPEELLPRLAKFHSASHFTLNLSNLSLPDTLEILYDCQGLVSSVEIYNLKDTTRGKFLPATMRQACPGDAVEMTNPERVSAQIAELRNALNEDNVIALKRAIRSVIWDFEVERLSLSNTCATPGLPDAFARAVEFMEMNERKKKLLDILFNIELLHRYYSRERPLGSRIGSGSTGQSRHQFGMGVVVLETLPAIARKKALEQADGRRKRLPVTARLSVNARTSCHKQPSSLFWDYVRRIPGLELAGCPQVLEWSLDSVQIHPGTPGNLLTLGGMQQTHPDNGLRFADPAQDLPPLSRQYLNTKLKNFLKVLIGFIPAFLTFFLTQDWWLLTYFGGVLWLGITGVRNVIQSVLGGGGLGRSPLVLWSSLVNWSRVADDLLFTGLSVPLLDYAVKILVMDRIFGVTASTSPGLLFTAMALANGVYISVHNVFRGFPRPVIVANFFRNILSIPLAICFSGLLGLGLQVAHVRGAEDILQKWAAILSKLASDCVAAVIEGLGDRNDNIHIREADYRSKIMIMFDVFSRLDVLFPEEDVLDMLASPGMFMETISYDARDLEKVLIVNALDLMYFWFCQPRAPKALDSICQQMSKEEWLIFLRSQYVLKRSQEIGQMFEDGLVGKDFAQARAFYLDRHQDYLHELEQMGHHRRIG